MIEMNQIYKCERCGNLLEVVGVGPGQLVCCEQDMKLLEEKTEDQGQEKHVPVVEKTDDGINVKVGAVPHPMEESHFIQWIEVLSGGNVQRKHLSPGSEPQASFRVDDKFTVREYCNIHGLWKA